MHYRQSAGALLLLISLLLTSCQRNPFAHRFLKAEPSPAEAVGTYELREAYVSMIDADLDETIRTHLPTPTIILRGDGTATLSHFPVFTEREEGFDYDWSGFTSMEARWAIAPVGAVSSSVDDTAVTVFGLYLTHTPIPVDAPTFTGTESIDGMIFTFYDGDQGQILGFEKVD